MTSLQQHIDAATSRYRRLPIFVAFERDEIPLPRFTDFFREQAMAARHFQDFIWASTQIEGDDDLARFAREHRRVDSGHYKWTAIDLERVGLAPMTLDDHFALGTLTTRIQLARILACFHDADRHARLVILAALEAAGAVTLGALHGYVMRHGMGSALLYLGKAHVAIEERQSDAISRVAGALFERDDARLHGLIETVFDALTRMFGDGGQRLYGDVVARLQA